jgi:hypothetical protein
MERPCTVPVTYITLVVKAPLDGPLGAGGKCETFKVANDRSVDLLDGKGDLGHDGNEIGTPSRIVVPAPRTRTWELLGDLDCATKAQQRASPSGIVDAPTIHFRLKLSRLKNIDNFEPLSHIPLDQCHTEIKPLVWA